MEAVQKKKSKKFINIGMSDIVRHPYYKEERNNGVRGLERILWNMGMNVKTDYNVFNATHRSLITNKVCKQDVFSGVERDDDNYIKAMKIIGKK